MNIYKVFAANLREESLRRGNFAEVCRGMGMNRQQFNKYLAGQSLPNAVTMRRICDYLHIQEHELLTERIKTDAIFNAKRSQRFLASLEHLLITAMPHQDLAHPPDIMKTIEGNYFGYFPIPNAPDKLLRSLVRVTKVRNLHYFTRLTRLSSPSKSHIFRGKHIGVVMASSNSVNFIGRNRVSPHQTSFLAFDTKNTLGGNYMFGVAITRSTDDSVAMPVGLQRLRATSLKEAITSLGHIRADDKSVDPIMRAAIEKRQPENHCLSFASFEMLLNVATADSL